jgi:hypothetical protein
MTPKAALITLGIIAFLALMFFFMMAMLGRVSLLAPPPLVN